MDLKALFKISHGVYLTGAKTSDNRFIGSCIDSCMVVEAEPAEIIVSLNKGSFTAQNVLQTKQLTLSILPEDAPHPLIERFGMNTSKTLDKWQQTPYFTFHDLPVYQDSVAYLYAEVRQIIETSGHFVFFCPVIEVKAGTMKKPLLYADYQEHKLIRSQSTKKVKWRCTMCGYLYEGEVPFEQLPNDWVCPLCNEPKTVFAVDTE